MSRPSLFVLTAALLLACGGPPQPGAKAQAKQAPPAKQPAAAPTTKADAPDAAPTKPTDATTASPVDDPDELAAVDPAPPEPEPEPEPAPAPKPGTSAPAGGNQTLAGWTPPADADPRSDAAVPPGTPTANAEAFKRLPVAKADGVPVSAIASNGLHFDSLVVGRGWEKSRCVEASERFRMDVDDRVNLCVRVVHPAELAEELSVEWTKPGTKTIRRSTISVKAMHAYLTRGYLPIKPGYAGEWLATIKAPDGTVLAELPFTIE